MDMEGLDDQASVAPSEADEAPEAKKRKSEELEDRHKRCKDAAGRDMAKFQEKVVAAFKANMVDRKCG